MADVLEWLLELPLGVWSLWLALEVALALRVAAGAPSRPGVLGAGSEPLPAALAPFVVLIPAHDEEAGLAQTLAALGDVGALGGRVLVVADNCSDRTAEVARAAGAEVVERRHEVLRGKGYALQAGVDALRADAPQTVVVLDADCRLSHADLARLVACSQARQQTVQAAYLMHAPADAGVGARISELAWLVKTWVRLQGIQALVGRVQLLGSGMAFPWPVLQCQKLATGHVVEDLKLTLELAEQGQRVWFEPRATVHSTFPSGEAARRQQSRRWEHGHLHVALTLAPRLAWTALRRRQWAALALALDVTVPPLSLLTLLLAAGWVVAALSWLLGWVGGWTFAAVSLYGLAFAAAIFAAWSRFGRDVVSPAQWLQVPLYVLRKLGIYRQFVQQRESRWVRTDRE